MWILSIQSICNSFISPAFFSVLFFFLCKFKVLNITPQMARLVSFMHRREQIQERGFIQGLYDSYILIYKEAKW